MIRSALAFTLLACTSLALYSSGSAVIQLDEAGLRDKVLKSNELWFVEFYAPWCGHCKALAPEYEKAAKALQGIVKVAAVDMDQHKNAGAAYNIRGFPTIKFFGLNKNSPADYNGQRTASAIIDFALSQIKSVTSSRLGGGGAKTDSGSKPNGSGSSGSSGNSKGGIVELTESDFAQQTGRDHWMVMFYAPWCGHCKRAMPDFEGAADEVKGAVKFGRVNCDEQKSLCGQYGVQGFPTIKYFHDGANEPYEGARSRDAFVEYATSKAKVQIKRLELTQLKNQATFDEYCKDFEGLCVLALLPDVLDSGADKRMEYLKELKEIAEANTRNPISFLWAQGGDHFALEEKLNMNFGYPSIVAIHMGKQKYAIMRKKYEKKSIEAFIGSLITGDARVSDLPSLPAIKEKKPKSTDDL